MNDQLSLRIQARRRGFSKSQRAISQYLEEHPEQVAFMTASKLGATVGVSESTVVRFATSWSTTQADLDELRQIL